MKRLFLCLAALLATALLYAQEIRSIDIDLYITDEGDAYVEQNWDVTVRHGTEWYIPIGNLNGCKIRGLSVEEDGVEFIDEGRSWDTDRSIEQKAGRSGIVEKGRDGVELCWGVGTLGPHRWTAGFVVLNLVQSLKDYDAFNFMFVNPGMVASPEHASLRVRRLDGARFETDSTRFWFFGCEGESRLDEDGTIFFETTKGMTNTNSVILMMRFEKGMFKCSKSRNMKFAKMQRKAFKGSSYKTERLSLMDILAYIVGGLFVLVIVIGILVVIYLIIREIILAILGRPWKKSVFGSANPKGWAREAPFGGDITIASALLEDGLNMVFRSVHPERRVGAYFLKWISEGTVQPVKNEKDRYNLQLPEKDPEFKDPCEQALYKKVKEAAGSNMILEDHELEVWAQGHFKSFSRWPDSVLRTGRSKLKSYEGDKVAESKKLLQFRNYLSEFTLSKEREVPEVALWGQYLVFAQLFGIADKVAKGLSKLYPDQFADYSEKLGMDSDSMRSSVALWTGSAAGAYRVASNRQSAAEAAAKSRSSSGFGGGSSVGGGGGFSGGGFGGGSR